MRSALRAGATACPGADAAAGDLGAPPPRADADRLGARPRAVPLRPGDRHHSLRAAASRCHPDRGVLRARRRRVARAPRPRAAMVCFALLTSSAMLVHLWDGRIEGALPLLRDGRAAGHLRGVVPVPAGVPVRARPPRADGRARRRLGLRPRGRRGAPVAVGRASTRCSSRALGVVNIVSWRMNEDAREDTRDSDQRFRSAFEDAPIGMALVGLDGDDPARQRAPVRRHRPHRRRSSRPPAGRRSRPRRTATAPPGRRRPASRSSAASRARDGSVGWGLWQHSLVARPRRPARLLGLPRARHLRPQGRRAPARLPGPPRPADRPAEPHAVPPATCAS